MKTSSGVGRTEPWFRLSTQIWQGGWADGGRTYFSNHTVVASIYPANTDPCATAAFTPT